MPTLLLIYIDFYNIFIADIAMLSNPFTQRSFPSSSLSCSYTYDRRYFPLAASNTQKPGFLITTQSTLPSVYGDMKSPYSTLGAREQHKVRNQYLQNPFHKSSLLEDVRSETGPFGSSSSHHYAGLAESQVTPTYTGKYYTADFTDYKPTDTYKPYPNKQIESPNYQNALKKTNSLKPEQKLKNSDKLKSGGFTPLNEDEENTLNRNPSFIDKIRSMGQQIEEDDPYSYQLPSFNSKFNLRREPSLGKKESLDSPKFNTRSNPPKYTDSHGVQANKLKGADYPPTISYQGKTFYYVNVDEL